MLVRDLENPGERTDFFARARSGEFVRLFRGVHISSRVWSALDADERHRALVTAAAAATSTENVYSHASAVGVWRLPWVGEWPEVVHVTGPDAAGGRSNRMLARHTTGVPNGVVSIGGITVTGLARTVADIARTESFARAVVVADAALRRTTHPHPYPEIPRTFVTCEQILGELSHVPLRHGLRKAERVANFADARADRPGESLSRVSMHVAGLPAPELQVRLRGASGREWIVDFFWRQAGLIGEFDGRWKYSDERFLRGRSSAQAVIDEKDREDDLRAAGYGVARWGWKVAMSPTMLRSQLVAAGLH